MKTELVYEIVGKNEEIQGEKVICLVFFFVWKYVWYVLRVTTGIQVCF